MTSEKLTREQLRAQIAYDAVKKLEGEDAAKDYGSMALRFPALLRSAGLVQALAFVHSRGNEGHKRFIHDFAEALLKLGDKSYSHDTLFYDTYFKEAQSAELPQYIRMTREALALADWFKRFAQSVLKAEPGE